MNIKILYDNQAQKGFASGWGFSALVNGTTLFDAGEKPGPLRANMNRLGVDPRDIQRVILSHEDWDHIGGLEVIAVCEKPEVYVPAAFSAETRARIRASNPDAVIIDVSGMRDLGEHMYATPQLGIRKKEISLAVRTDKGVVLVVGCSHPGLHRIMKKASALGPIYGVIGGFHGFRKLSALADVTYIAPTHCTKKKDAIRKRYPEQTHSVKAGSVIDL